MNKIRPQQLQSGSKFSNQAGRGGVWRCSGGRRPGNATEEDEEGEKEVEDEEEEVEELLIKTQSCPTSFQVPPAFPASSSELFPSVFLFTTSPLPASRRTCSTYST